MNKHQLSSNVSLVLLLLYLPFGVFAVLRLPVGSSGVHQWLPKGREERQRYERFLSEFGSDQVLMISWEGANLDDPRVDQFIKLLRADSDYDLYISSIVSPIEVVEQMVRPPLGMRWSAVTARLEGVLIGTGGTLTIIAMVNDRGVREHTRVIDLVRQVADRVPRLGKESLRLVGTVFESYAVDRAAEQSLTQLVLPSSILALAASWVCVGSMRAVLLVMLLAGAGQLLAVSLVYYGGFEFSAVLIVLPTLIFMLTLSGAVHLVNYYFDSFHEPATNRGLSALKKGWWPCVLSSVTTMLGMASLLFSELVPVQQFGALSAISLGIATTVLLLVFPAAANLIFSLGRKSSSKGRDECGYIEHAEQNAAQQGSLVQSDGRLAQTMQPNLRKQLHCEQPIIARRVTIRKELIGAYLSWLNRKKNLLAVAAISLLIMAGAGLASLRSSTKFCDMFSESHQTHRDMVWFENNVGLIATVEVLLSFDRNNDDSLLDQAILVSDVSRELRRSSEVGGAYSATSVLPTLTNTKGVRATILRAAQKRGIQDNLNQLMRDGLIHQTDQKITWRISTRVSAVSSAGYGELTEVVKKIVLRAVSKSSLQPNIEFTGLSPVMHETQLTLLSDLGYSFLSAYLLITPVMMWVVRSFWGGVLIMIPNVLPIVLVFGVMGWVGWSLDIAGILTASVALGIAVDDTLHFVCWYSNSLASNNAESQVIPAALGDEGTHDSSNDDSEFALAPTQERRFRAIQATFFACASAMIHTTLICCCAMTPFLLANFVPTIQFATLMICILISAIIGDLLVLPVLLLSAAGRIIRSEKMR